MQFPWKRPPISVDCDKRSGKSVLFPDHLDVGSRPRKFGKLRNVLLKQPPGGTGGQRVHERRDLIVRASDLVQKVLQTMARWSKRSPTRLVSRRTAVWDMRPLGSGNNSLRSAAARRSGMSLPHFDKR